MPTLLSFGAGLLGALLLALAVVLPWFAVPVDVVNGVVTGAQPPVTVAYRIACLGAIGLLVYAFGRSMRARQRAAQVLAVLLGLLFFFPYFVMAWSPAVAAQASWLQTEHENLSWLGGDIYNAQEYRGVDGKIRVYVADPARQVGVFKLPNWNPHAVGWGRIIDVVDWIGYSNRFCEFVRLGWFLAIGGTILMLTGFCRERQAVDLKLTRNVAQILIGFVGCGMVLAMIPPMAAASQLTRAREAVYRGEYQRGLDSLNVAALWLPVIRQDTYFIAQCGMLEAAIGLDTPSARLHKATALEAGHFHQQARLAYLKLIEETADGTGVHREAVRGLLSAGIHDLNTGSNQSAISLLQKVLVEEPCNIKANYTLQLAYLRTGQFDALESLADRMTKVYGYFSFPSKEPVLGATKENMAYAAFQQNRPNQALAAWRSITAK